MSRHLTDEVLLEVLEGEAERDAREHVAGCARCAARVGEAAEGRSLAAAGREVPEPSPLYWQAFQREMSERIGQEAEPEAAAGWRRFFGIGSLVPAVAAVALLLAVLPVRKALAPAPGGLTTGRTLPAWEALPASADDPGLLVLEGLANGGSQLDLMVGCRSVADCLVSSSDEESEAVVSVLQSLLEARS